MGGTSISPIEGNLSPKNNGYSPDRMDLGARVTKVDNRWMPNISIIVKIAAAIFLLPIIIILIHDVLVGGDSPTKPKPQSFPAAKARPLTQQEPATAARQRKKARRKRTKESNFPEKTKPKAPRQKPVEDRTNLPQADQKLVEETTEKVRKTVVPPPPKNLAKEERKAKLAESILDNLKNLKSLSQVSDIERQLKEAVQLKAITPRQKEVIVAALNRFQQGRIVTSLPHQETIERILAAGEFKTFLRNVHAQGRKNVMVRLKQATSLKGLAEKARIINRNPEDLFPDKYQTLLRELNSFVRDFKALNKKAEGLPSFTPTPLREGLQNAIAELNLRDLFEESDIERSVQNILGKALAKQKDQIFLAQRANKKLAERKPQEARPLQPVQNGFRKQIEMFEKKIHEGKENNTPSTIRRSHGKTQSTKSPKKKLLTQTFARINSLDLQSKSASGELFDIKTLLANNMHLFAPKEQPAIRELIKALEILRDRDLNAFRPSKEEHRLLEIMKLELTPYGIRIPINGEIEKTVQMEIKSELLRKIKDSSRSLATLRKVLAHETKRLRVVATKKRLEGSIPSFGNFKPLPTDLSKNVGLIVHHLETLRKPFKSEFEKKWNKKLEKYDKRSQSEDRFSKVFSKHGDGQWIDDIDFHFDGFIDEYVGSKKTDFFNLLLNTSANNLAPVLQSSLKKISHKERLQSIFKLNYNKRFKRMEFYLPYIVKVYDQELDSDRNMGGGTCLQNSADRYLLLMKSPTVESSKIALGSSRKGRFTRMNFNQLSNKAISQRNRNQILDKGFSRIGLKEDTFIEIMSKRRRDLYNALFREIQPQENQINTNFILIMRSSEGGPGHAINIQVDSSENIFRLIDDNIGTIQCPDYETFKKVLICRLKSSYRAYDLLSLHTYQRI